MSITRENVRWGETDPEIEPDYKPVCIAAIFGILIALLTPIALVHPLLWAIPFIGVLVNALALRQIARSAGMTGQKLATVGLVVSIFMSCFAPASKLTHEALLRSDGEKFAKLWFDFLRHQQPQLAHQLTVLPAERRPLDSGVWEFYRNDVALTNVIRDYVKGPLVRTMLELGDRAEVRLYEFESTAILDATGTLENIYAVTFDDGGVKKTFFVKLKLYHDGAPKSGPPGWRILTAEGGSRPKSWPAT